MSYLQDNLNRRNFLVGAGAALAVSVAGLQTALARGEGGARLVRPSSGESMFLPVRWTSNDLLKCSVLFRDVKDRDQAIYVDPALLDLLVRLNVAADQITGAPCSITVTSAFRTKAHNAALEGAAKTSLHMVGRAVDYKIPGFENLAAAKLSAMIGAGGVGVYPNFSHMDCGKDRTWVAKTRKS